MEVRGQGGGVCQPQGHSVGRAWGNALKLAQKRKARREGPEPGSECAGPRAAWEPVTEAGRGVESWVRIPRSGAQAKVEEADRDQRKNRQGSHNLDQESSG